jgi:hypothetical protein
LKSLKNTTVLYGTDAESSDPQALAVYSPVASAGASANKSKKFAGKCFNCGKNGHRAGDCRVKTKTGDGEAKPQESKKTGGQDWKKKAKC